MTIAEAREKCKSLLAHVPRDVLILFVLILACLASFGLGYLTGEARAAGQGSPLVVLPAAPAAGRSDIVGSKNGTKYYYASCAGATRISAANKVFFASAGEAEALGYQLAEGCTAP
ncbi:hypothetical protein HY091_00880 [Candidatus Kaiserbacteria bacterium]|nr:hypothetical protein [Candidatus Kaiserbacteria bacterium]